MEPHFADFIRVQKHLCKKEDKIDDIIADMKLANKASIRVDILEIYKDNFIKLKELYKDKELNLMIENLQINYDFKNIWLIEDIEFINKISPKMLTIHDFIWTVENIKALTLLNWTNVDLRYSDNKINEDIYLWFINTPIKLFDSNSDQLFIFEWESINFIFEKDELKKNIFENNGFDHVELFKTNTSNFLFIPLSIIGSLSYSRFREILNVDDINKQFDDMGFKHEFNTNGLVVPMGYSNGKFNELYDADTDWLSQIKNI